MLQTVPVKDILFMLQIKRVDLSSKACETVLGSGEAGSVLNADVRRVQINEPGGVCVHPGGKLLYIADTNNHSIKVFDIQENTLSEVGVIVTWQCTGITHV